MLLRLKLLRVRLEELDRLLRVHTRHVVEGGRGDVVGLPLAHEGVVVEKVLELRGVAVGLGAENFLGFGSVGCGGVLVRGGMGVGKGENLVRGDRAVGE